MGELISALQRLQEIELRISRLRRREERKARQIEQLEADFRRMQDEIAGFQAECRRQQVEVDQLDREVETREASILRHREELLKARTNKDYSAILTAINAEKADSAKIEKLALEKLGSLETAQAEVDARLKIQAESGERIAAAQRDLEEYQASTADERRDLQQQRDAAAEAVPPTAMATFTRVAERHAGEALAEVIRQHPKRQEYACGGCNMQVPLDAVNTVRLQNEIRLCPSCGRILCLAANATTRS